MKELDFDELDRAVNSLMSGVPKSEPVKADDVKTITLDEKKVDDGVAATFAASVPTPHVSEPVASDPSVIASPAPAPVVEATPAPAPSVPLASRRGGRFMDVVHPSSDMSKSTPVQPTSRQGVTIQPRPAAPTTVQPAVPAPQSEPVQEAAAPVSDYSPQPKDEWPDPLDMTAKEESPVAAESEPAETNQDASTTDTTDDLPLTSPFLSDAKVEKRPLGGAAPAPVEELSRVPAPTALGTDEKDGDEDEQLPAEPVETSAPLPEELSGDLMAIESDTHPVTSTSEPAAQPAESASAAPVTSVRPEAPAGPSSIPQQYKEEASTGDQTSGAIFDTASYHQPLTHPVKKKSGWLWVVAVVIVLLLGAAGGAALYFLGIV